MNMATPVQLPEKKRRGKRSAWTALASHYKNVSKLQLRDLFAEDSERGERMSVEAVGLYLDYSKNRITNETLKLLLK
jgi:glucose-6-phosphate isomerase